MGSSSYPRSLQRLTIQSHYDTKTMEHFTEPLPIFPENLPQEDVKWDYFDDDILRYTYFAWSWLDLVEAYWWAQKDMLAAQIGEPNWFAQTQEMCDILSECRARGYDEHDFFRAVDNFYEV